MEKQRINGVDIAVRVKGEGERTLIFLHGNTESSEIFSEMEETISFEGRTVFVDSRGHGESGMGRPFTIAQFARDLHELIAKNSWKHITVVGYSDGANVAMSLEKQYPATAERLILISGNYKATGMRFVRLLRLLYLAMLPCCWLRTVRKKMDYLSLMLWDYGVAEDDLKAFQAKTLVVSAEKDVIKPSHTQKIRQSIHGAEYFLCKGYTHFNLLNDTLLWKEIERRIKG